MSSLINNFDKECPWAMFSRKIVISLEFLIFLSEILLLILLVCVVFGPISIKDPSAPLDT